MITIGQLTRSGAECEMSYFVVAWIKMWSPSSATRLSGTLPPEKLPEIDMDTASPRSESESGAKSAGGLLALLAASKLGRIEAVLSAADATLCRMTSMGSLMASSGHLVPWRPRWTASSS